MRHKTVLMGVGVCLFFLLPSLVYTQQVTFGQGVRDTLYINCTPPDFFEKDSISVGFDLVFWTDASLANEVIGGWDAALLMTSSNTKASARAILDEDADGPIYKGTASGFPNDWEARFNAAVPSSGFLPATVIYGAIQDLLPPANRGPSLSAGIHILAHIIIKVKDTTTICIDTTSTEFPVCHFVTNDGNCDEPLWIKKPCCPVAPLSCLYKPGDANGDGKVDLTDLIFILNRVMRGGPAPIFECQADLNADGIVTLLDIFLGVNYLYKGGNPPLKSWACCL